MANNVVINGLTAVHGGSQGTLLTQDVCKVPGKTCTPSTFQNVAESKDAAKTAATVFINGQPACHAKSIFAKSKGDEAGRCGGTQSGTTTQMAEFITSSPNVMIEGQPAVRQSDQMVSNMRNTPPAALQQPGAGQPPALKPREAAAHDPAEAPDELPWSHHGAADVATHKARIESEEEQA